jgi:hypothetical protein
MGTQAESWTDIYATTHEQRLAQSMQFAREELAAKYGAAETRAKYMKDLVSMYDKALTDAQKALVDYETARGRKASDPASNADATARLLGVMAQAGGDIAAETGRAAQRKLEAAGVVEGRYRLSSGQSSAVGGAGDKIATSVDATYRTSSDIDRAVGTALGSIPDGTFAPGTDASKTAAAELYGRLDAELRRLSPTVYGADATAPDRLKAAIAAKVGVAALYADRAEVDSDRKIAVAKEQKIVGQTGTGVSADAAKIAKDKLKEIGQPISDDGSKAIGDFKQAGQYFDLIAGGATIAEAKAAIKEGITAGKDKEGKDKTADEMRADFEKSFEDTRSALSTSRDFDQAKLFDPTYVDVYARSIKSGKALTGAQKEFSAAVDALSNVPTEEAARTRGVEIYEPISPGLPKRSKEAGVILEERAQRSRITGMPQSDDDLMASRILERAPQLPDEERIIAGASLAAIRELDKGWNPDKFKAGKGGDFGGNMSAEEFEALGMGPASGLGYRLYSNVKEKQLRDTSPKGIVQYASDLAGGDVGLRDSVLQEYYKHMGYDMRGTKVMKAKADVEKVEVPKPVDISGIKLEETEF